MSTDKNIEAAENANFKNAMAMMAAAVEVVATDGKAGRGGLTVTAACSVSQEPPRLLVCVNTSASAHRVVVENGRLSLNILAKGQEAVAGAFGGKVPPEQRFEVGEWGSDELGQPILKDACARFSCSIHDTMRSGTHTIFLCDVHVADSQRGPLPLVYFDRMMTTLPQVARAEA
ncbi:flavin reductase (DIM6/NTAB) family NADH-FMN oxidoreductase RutF [Agrobacterium larrymoorei]|uniref:Flavin reductase (DIM6/NTAB) family NADH-FMN oxidoreductase RutF n=1 Tax=Agrobacterium larrymoorei TaxID=160699 RepID=A0AAJ2BCZ0_9HYPH|nr:flavin reductase family protein [Agrobacterium larrymoorei]MDR6101538.1 flavin reductase (DIM6/NTAB) family NADH-FMN oxidoreductase RutF [Agrobacterium larrymoorei]